MKPSQLLNRLFKRWICAGFIQVALPCFLAQTEIASAQSVIAPSPQVSIVPPALQEILNGEEPADASSMDAVAATAPAPLNPLQIGPVVLLPHFVDQFLYGDGIQALPGQQSKTTINSFSPGILMDLGTHWTLDYTPTWTAYSNKAFRDTVDEVIRLDGIKNFDAWTVQFAQDYYYTSEPIVETGEQTTETDYSTTFKAAHSFDSKLAVDLSVSQFLRFPVGFPSSLEWSTLDWLNYQLSTRLTGGIGSGVGYVAEDSGSNEFFVEPQARINLRATDKLSLTLSGGVEELQFIGADEPRNDSPIYDLSILYQPVETTKLTLSAGQQIEVSYYANQTTKNTQFAAVLDQRLLEHYYINIDVQQQRLYFFSSTNALTSGRDDNQLSVIIRLSTTVLQKVTVALVYQKSRNSSNIFGYGFDSAQEGFEIGYRY